MTNSPAKFTAPATLEIVRVLPATCQRVWEYLVDPELRQKWFCAGERGNQAGEPFVMAFDHRRLSTSAPPEGTDCGDAVTVHGTIIEFQPPHKLSYHWPGDDEDDASVVTIELTAEGDNTRLHLIHSKLTNPEFRKSASAGWHAHLDLLLDVVQDQDARDFWVHYGELKAQYDAQVTEAVD